MVRTHGPHMPVTLAETLPLKQGPSDTSLRYFPLTHPSATLASGAYVSTTHRVIKIDDDETSEETTTTTSRDGETLASATLSSNSAASSSTASISSIATMPAGFGVKDRMSTPCFIHLKQKCPLSDKYGSAEHYLLDRLVSCACE